MPVPSASGLRTLPDGVGVAVSSPASSANLGPGFDTIGLALGVRDDYEVTVTGDRLVVDVEGEGADAVPRGPGHLVVRCLADGLAHLGYALPAGLYVRATNRVPHSRGMGSSATVIVAGYAAASALARLADAAAGGPDADDLVDRSLVNDLAGAREGHPDNSSASVFGHMTVSWAEEPPGLAPVGTAVLDVHPDVEPVLLVPQEHLATATARAALPEQVPLRDAALGAGRAALLVEAMTRRPELLLPATVDVLHQEQRRGAYPTSMGLVDDLRSRGLAAVISGAGPTVLVLATRDRVAEASAVRLPDGWGLRTPGIDAHGVQARALR